MLSILIKSPCTVSGSPRTGYPIPCPRQYKYGEVTCAAARLAQFLPRTCPARAQTWPSLSCGGKYLLVRSTAALPVPRSRTRCGALDMWLADNF